MKYCGKKEIKLDDRAEEGEKDEENKEDDK